MNRILVSLGVLVAIGFAVYGLFLFEGSPDPTTTRARRSTTSGVRAETTSADLPEPAPPPAAAERSDSERSGTLKPKPTPTEPARNAAKPAPKMPSHPAPLQPAPPAAVNTPSGDAHVDVLEEAPDATEGDTMVWGLDKESIHEALLANTEAYRKCYEEWAEVTPGLGGRLNIQFTIGKAAEDAELASVIDISAAESEMNHAFFEGCVMNVVSTLKFEPPDKGTVSVHIPYRFRTEDNQPSSPDGAPSPSGTGRSPGF